jgi:hypothetical protein
LFLFFDVQGGFLGLHHCRKIFFSAGKGSEVGQFPFFGGGRRVHLFFSPGGTEKIRTPPKAKEEKIHAISN